MILRPTYPQILLPATIAAVLLSDGFVASQNQCLFRQGSDLSTAAKRKAYAECMAAEKYRLKVGCEEGATSSACYDRQQ